MIDQATAAIVEAIDEHAAGPPRGRRDRALLRLGDGADPQVFDPTLGC